jgi:AraC family ethanolamine operon transcriptional activator
MYDDFARALAQIPAGPGHAASGQPAAGVLRFSDVEEQAGALTGWNQNYLQLSAGAFQGELCQLQGAGIRLFVERVRPSVFQVGVLPRQVLALGIPLEASACSMFCGTPCGTDVLHVFSGSAGFEFRSAPGHTMLGIELQLGPSGDQGLAHPAWPTQAGALRLTPAAQADLKNYLLKLFRSAQARPELLSSAAVVAAVADDLLDHLAQAARACGDEAVAETCSHWGLVRQACARVNQQLDQAPTTVGQLCLDLGVSRRTLQNGFQRVLDVNPLAYLKAVRLHQARQALKRVSSVTEAATAFGFWHFGHFSRDYRAMFGEPPSATLRRHVKRS